jgi:N-acetylmuramoyl-L-alanine amidase
MKIFLSASTQEHNAYKTGGVEETYMRIVAAAAAPYLQAHGYQVKIGGTISASDNVSQSDAWGADYHIAIHSDAGGGDGTTIFYFSKNAQGKLLAEHIYAEIAPFSPGVDNGVKTGDKYVEVNAPHATSVLIEVEFHDSIQGSTWIKANEEQIGKKLAEGILAFLGVGANTKPIPPKPPVAPPKPPIAPPKPKPVHTGKVTAKTGLKVRSGPGLRYKAVGSLKYGTVVTILSTSGGWHKIKYNYEAGFAYVSSSYVS